MRQHWEVSAQRTEPSTSIPRNTSTTNFAELLCKERPTPNQRSPHSKSRFSLASSRRSTSNGSENSQILYMSNGKGKTRRANRSLSSIGNTPKIVEDSKQYEPNEELTRDIIDREILEWQFVCQTGRPFWWSPESKYTRLKKVSPTLDNIRQPKPGKREFDAKPIAQYSAQRRAVSENYITDPSTVHDLAQMVAVQLLSACFTLPPVAGICHTRSINEDDKGSFLRDPPMISSLRMHTHFRYSPSFGHQGQNTSPDQRWSGAYDGPSPNNSSAFASRSRPGVHDYASSGRSRSDVQDSNCNDLVDVNATQRSDGRIHKHTGPEPKGRYRLQPVIRSEPHPVFIQPVRELVVQRWRNFRRRMSGSLYGSLPARASEDQMSMSESPSSIDSSPAMSSDGKARRRRAQERGDIASSSVDIVAHNNTPVSSIPNSRSTSPSLRAASVPVIPRTVTRPSYSSRSQSIPLSAPATIPVPYAREDYGPHSPAPARAYAREDHGLHSPAPARAYAREDHGLHSPAPARASAGSARSYAPRRASGHRRSLLSEVFTPDDIPLEAKYTRGLLSPAGSALASPRDSAGMDERPNIGNLSNHAATDSILFTLSDLRGTDRPPMKRTSTTGTQVFIPSEDGVELDGLPVGLPKDAFAVRRERTYL